MHGGVAHIQCFKASLKPNKCGVWQLAGYPSVAEVKDQQRAAAVPERTGGHEGHTGVCKPQL